MNKVLFATLAAMLGMTSASAADLPTNKPAPSLPSVYPPFNWNGLYLGLNGGFGWAGSHSDGAVAGGTIGYNFQINEIVVGAEADWDFASIGGRSSDGFGDYAKTRLTSLTTERLRLGYAVDRTLFFLTGGYAGGYVHNSLLDGPDGVYGSQDRWRNGYAIGGGIEYAFNNHVSAKAEYLYSQFGSQQIDVGPVSARSSMNPSLVRLGVNYRF